MPICASSALLRASSSWPAPAGSVIRAITGGAFGGAADRAAENPASQAAASATRTGDS
jgi:hypothetical protein